MKRALIASTILVMLGFLTISFSPTTVTAQGPPACLNDCAPAAAEAFRECMALPEASLEICQPRACAAFIACVLNHEPPCQGIPGNADPTHSVPFCSSPD